MLERFPKKKVPRRRDRLKKLVQKKGQVKKTDGHF
jgi:hypothetical protein